MRKAASMNRNARFPVLAAVFLGAALLWPAARAAAQEPPASPPPSQNAAANLGGRKACMADMQKFCADAEPGGGRKMACMRQHQDELSDACKTALAERRAMRRQRQADQGEGAAPGGAGAAPN
jgi:hypothetical protein